MANPKPLAAVKDLVLNQGADFRFTVKIKDLDVTDYKFYCKIRPEATSPEVVAEAIATILDETQGIVEFHFEDDDTGDVPLDGANYSDFGEFTYDVLMETPDGEVTRLLNGMCYISPGVSHY